MPDAFDEAWGQQPKPGGDAFDAAWGEEPAKPPAIPHDIAAPRRGPEPQFAPVYFGDQQMLALDTAQEHPLPDPNQNLYSDAQRVQSIFTGVIEPEVAKSPERFAKVWSIAKRSGLNFNTVDARADEFIDADAKAKQDPVEWVRTHPGLADYVLRNPQIGVLVSYDPGLDRISRNLNDIYTYGKAELTKGALGLGLMTKVDDEGKPLPTEWSELNDKLATDIDQEQAANPLIKKPQAGVARLTEDAKKVNESPFGGALAAARRTDEAVAGLNADMLWFDIAMRRHPFVGPPKGTSVQERLALDYEQASEPRAYNQGEASQFFGKAGGGVSSSIMVGADTIKGATAAGAALGVPAAGVTFASTRNPELAAEAFWEAAGVGAKLGGSSGAYVGTLRSEMGGAYKELLRTTTDDGQPVPEPVAFAGAMIYGNLASAIEVGTMGPMLKVFGPAGEFIRTGSRKEAVAALLKNPLFLNASKRLAKQWAEATLTESGEEGFQAATKDATKYFVTSVFAIANRIGSGEDIGSALSGGAQKGQYGLGGGVDVGGAVAESVEALPSSALLAGTGAVSQSVQARALGALPGVGATWEAARSSTARYQAAKIGAAFDIHEQVMLSDLAHESASIIHELANFVESPTKHADPEGVAEALQRGGLGPNVHTDAKQLVKFYQSKRLDVAKAAVKDIGPDGAKQLDEALKTGQPVAVPTSSFIQWDDEQKKALEPHTTTRSDLATPAQANQKMFDERVEALVKQLQTGPMPAESEGEANLLAVAEHELALTENPKLAREKMEALRAFVRVKAETEGKSADELFKSFAILIGRADPTMEEVLNNRLEQGRVNRAEELLRDENTGLPNELAFDRSKAPEGKPLVGHLSVEGYKWLNDSAGHGKADLLGRAVGMALQDQTTAYKLPGSDFAFHVKDKAELDAIAEKVRQALPPQLRGFAITTAVGATRGEASATNQAAIDEQVKKGERANPRPPHPTLEGESANAQRPLGLPKESDEKAQAQAIAIPETKASAAIAPEAVESVTKLTPEDYFKTAYRDQLTGTWTRRAWDAMRRKAHVVMIDAAGLGNLNKLGGKEVGNILLRSIGRFAAELSGGHFDFTHLSGDEFAAQHDDPVALEAFMDHLQALVGRAPLDFTVVADVPELNARAGELRRHTMSLHTGYGNRSLDQADHDLNERKSKRKRARELGINRGADLRRRNPLGDAGLREGAGERADARNPEAPAGQREVASVGGGDRSLGRVDTGGSEAGGNQGVDVQPAGGSQEESARSTAARGEGPVARGPNAGEARSEAEVKLDYLREKFARARNPTIKSAWKKLLDWQESGGKGEFPSDLPGNLEKAAAATVGIANPKGVWWDEQGRDMRRPMKGDKRKGGDLANRKARQYGIGLSGNAADFKEGQYTGGPMIFQGTEKTLLYQFPTPEQSLESLQLQRVFIDEALQRGAKVVDSTEALIERLQSTPFDTNKGDEATVIYESMTGKAALGFESIERAVAWIRDHQQRGGATILGAFVEPKYRVRVADRSNRMTEARVMNRGEREAIGVDGRMTEELGPDVMPGTVANETRITEPGFERAGLVTHPAAQLPESKNLPEQAEAEAAPTPSQALGGETVTPKDWGNGVVIDKSGTKLYQGGEQKVGPVWHSAVETEVENEQQDQPPVWTVTVPKALRDLVLEKGQPLFAGPKKGEESQGPRGYTGMSYEQAVDGGLTRLYNVVLNPNADLSTFMHESAHVFLDMMAHLAMRPDASDRLRLDWALTLKYLKATSAKDFDLAQSGEAAREKHEKFAEAFERYLYEGKAPSSKLEGAFARYRLWIAKVYGNANVPGAHINDEIRQVFDRMLATDAEIEEQKRRMGDIRPAAANLLGLDPEHFREHIEAATEATSVTRKRIDMAVYKDLLREKESWWKEQLKAEKEKAKQDYEALPARQLQNALANRGDIKTGPLDEAKVKEAIGPLARKLGKEAVKKDGADPGPIAEFFGYATTEAMLKELLALQPKNAWVKETADKRMAEKHPELLAETHQLQERIDKGLHGDADTKFLEDEVRLMAKRMSVPGTPLTGAQIAPVEQAKKAARRIVEERSVQRLDSSQALAAERKSATEAMLAADKGNHTQAFVKYIERLTNHYVWKYLLEAREMRDATLKLAHDVERDVTGTKSTLGKASPVYRDEMANALGELGLGEEGDTFSPDALIRQMEKDNAEGRTVIIGFDPDAIQAIFDKVSRYGRGKPKGLAYTVLTVKELRAVRDMMANVKDAARGITTVLVNEKRLDKEEVVQFIIDAFKQNLSALPPPGTKGAATMWRAAGGLWNWADGSQLKPETVLQWLADGNTASIVWRALGQPLQDAKHKEQDLMDGPVKMLVQAQEKMGLRQRVRGGERIDGRKLFPEHTEQFEPPQRRWEFIQMLLHMGNASNKKKMLEGRKIRETEVWDAFLKLGITKEEMDYVQANWDAAEALKKEAFDLDERDTGIRPEEVEAEPVNTPYGQYRGGYFPVAYETRTNVGQRQEASLQPAGFAAAATNHNYLKSRAEDFVQIVSFDPNKIYKHIAQVAHDIAFRERLRSVALLFRTQRLRDVLIERIGQERADIFEEWLRDIGAMKGLEGGTPFLMAMQTLRGTLSVGVLGYSLPNVLEDAVTGIVGAGFSGVINPAHVAAAMSDIEGSTIGDMSGLEKAEAESGELRSRHKQLNRELLSNIKRWTSRLSGKAALAKAPLDFVRENAFVMQEIVDRRVSAAIYLAAKRQALAGIATPTEEQVRDAILDAEAKVRLLLPTSHVVDSAAVMRDRGVVGGLMVFQRFWSQAYNLTRAQQGRDVFSKQSANAMGTVMGFIFAYAILGSLARGQGKQPDETWPAWFIRQIVTGTAGQFVGGGDVSSSIWSLAYGGKKREPRNNSLAGMLQGIITLLAKASNGDKEADERAGAALRASGLMTGLPPLQAMKMMGYLYDLAQGKVHARGPFDVIGGLGYGQSSKQDANIPTMIQDVLSGEPVGMGPR